MLKTTAVEKVVSNSFTVISCISCGSSEENHNRSGVTNGKEEYTREWEVRRDGSEGGVNDG
jgi:hypothetical protein